MKALQAIFTYALIITFTSISFAQDGKVYVEISGIDEIEGDLSIGLFNDAELFPQNGKAFQGSRVKVETSKISYTFENIPAGDYALAIYHDENSDGELGKNFLGMPSEDYVFSNYATGTMGPPSFEDAMFTHKDSTTIKLNLNE